MQSEIFQDQLWNFSTAYFTSSRYEVASEDMSQFLKDVSETATENDVHIFSQYNEINNKYLSTLHIYGDDKVIRQTLKNTANIEESEYTALVSGITKVKFHNLSELQSTSVGYENFISYIGNEDNIISAYQKLSEKYSLTYPEYWNSTEKDMIFIIWGMIIALMIVLNVIEVVRRKKEVVVRVSLGESAGFIAFKAALFDVTFDIALFIVAKILLSNYISGAYENRLVTILYSIGIILSTIPYCSFCFFDIRKAFANATHKRGVDFLIYSLKFIAGVAAVFTITTNISSIHNNLFTNEHLLEEYYDANYFTVKTTDFNAEKEEAFWVQGVKDFKFRPNETQYKMFYRSGNSEKPAEFVQICPNCNSRLVPDNANSGRNYKPFTLKVINLVDQRNGQFYKKGIDAQKTIVCRWFEKLSTADYEEILDNIELAFSDAFKSNAQRRNVEQQVRALIDAGMLPPEMFESAVNNMLQNAPNTKSVERYVAMCDDLFARKKAEDPAGYTEWLSHFSFKLMQYDTLKYAKRIITLEEAIQRQLDMEFIDSPEEITALNDKLGIANMQVSCDIQIINCTYGYSRRVADPKNSTNKNCRLKLNAYDRTRDGTANLVYGAKLDTEGILFEISQRRIIEWLYENKIIGEEQLPDLDDDVSVKKWFAEYVHSDVITMFGEIDDSEKITKNVFALLHSMSHAFMNAAGELSGLSSNSLTEIILVETASIFIYAQTSQGIPLGALSGMAESNYAYFLKKAFNETKNCVFDPICTERDDTACSACLIIPEISCNHFNAELGRKYLYSIDGVDTPAVGFWEM